MNTLIKQLAEQAGATHKQNLGVYQFYEHELQQFAELIAEACAKLCESMRPSKQEYDQRFYTACTLCANAIRARGE